jgi:hypothetical protein
MDLLRVFRVARRHWVITMIGVLLGVFCALLVSFKFAVAGGRMRVEKRSATTYKTELQLLITEPGYGMGSAGLLEYSLPNAFGKTREMAPVYAQLVLSDAVLRAASLKIGSPVEELVEAEAIEDTPIVQVTLTGTDARRLTALALALGQSLKEYLAKNQDFYGVPPGDRLSVSILASPKDPVPEKSREWEFALLALLVPTGTSVGIGLILERGRGVPNGAGLAQIQQGSPRQDRDGQEPLQAQAPQLQVPSEQRQQDQTEQEEPHQPRSRYELRARPEAKWKRA